MTSLIAKIAIMPDPDHTPFAIEVYKQMNKDYLSENASDEEVMDIINEDEFFHMDEVKLCVLKQLLEAKHIIDTEYSAKHLYILSIDESYHSKDFYGDIPVICFEITPSGAQSDLDEGALNELIDSYNYIMLGIASTYDLHVVDGKLPFVIEQTKAPTPPKHLKETAVLRKVQEELGLL